MKVHQFLQLLLGQDQNGEITFGCDAKEFVVACILDHGPNGEDTSVELALKPTEAELYHRRLGEHLTVEFSRYYPNMSESELRYSGEAMVWEFKPDVDLDSIIYIQLNAGGSDEAWYVFEQENSPTIVTIPLLPEA